MTIDSDDDDGDKNKDKHKDDRRKFRKDELLMLKIINLKNTRQAGRKRK